MVCMIWPFEIGDFERLVINDTTFNKTITDDLLRCDLLQNTGKGRQKIDQGIFVSFR